jgi:transposase-like protein
MMQKDIQLVPGTEGARRASEVAGKERTEAVPDTEVSEKPTRRRFTADYKQHILKLADACTETGDIGALLRREGLYASTLAYWRRQRDKGTLSALNPKKRGRKASEQAPLIREAGKLRKENERLKERLRKAELIIDVQKKVALMLGDPLEPSTKEENA